MFGLSLRPRARPQPPTRQDLVLKYVSRSGRGLEIGPNFSPLAPKAAGFDCLSMDVFRTEEVRRRAEEDPNVPRDLLSRIEDVDVVGSAADIGRLASEQFGAGSLDYILSSHNLEHVPDPIGFLRGCAVALKPGGCLSMAIPDLRCCMDYFRWPSTMADWLSAYFEGRERPAPAQHFTALSMVAHARTLAGIAGSFPIDQPRSRITPEPRLNEAYLAWRSWLDAPHDRYEDCHCWAFTPSSLAQLVLETRFLGLATLEVIEVSDLHGAEFFIHLRNSDAPAPSPEAFYAERERLARQAIQEIARKA